LNFSMAFTIAYPPDVAQYHSCKKRACSLCQCGESFP